MIRVKICTVQVVGTESVRFIAPEGLSFGDQVQSCRGWADKYGTRNDSLLPTRQPAWVSPDGLDIWILRYEDQDDVDVLA